MRNYILAFLRYASVSVAVMLLTLSFSTGQFPPPISQSFQSLKNMKGLMNMSNSTMKIANAKKAQDKILSEIENEDKNSTRGPASSDVTCSADKIKSLEFEVALLKSKLNRTEWEAEQLKSHVDALVQK